MALEPLRDPGPEHGKDHAPGVVTRVFVAGPGVPETDYEEPLTGLVAGIGPRARQTPVHR